MNGGRRRLALGGAPLLPALPALVFLLLFFYAPLGRVFLEALTAAQPGEPSAVAQVLGGPRFWHLLKFTSLQAVYSALGSLALGFPLGYILANRSFPGRNLLRSLTLVPFVLPSVVVALGFILFLGNQGALNRALDALFGVKIPFLYGLQTIILAHAFYNAPVVARAVHAAWERLDPSYEEAARSLGAGTLPRFAGVVLPLTVSGAVTGGLMAFIFSFFSFSIVLALGGARFATLEVEIYTQVRIFLNFANGAAYALLQTLFSLIASFVYLGVERRFLRETASSRPRPAPPLARLTPANACLWAYLALAGLFYIGPLAAILHQSLEGTDGSLSLQAYSFVFGEAYDPRIGDTPLQAVRNSLLFAAGAVAIALPLGSLLALGLSLWRKARPGRLAGWLAQALESLALAPLAVSAVAFGFAALRAYRAGPWAGLRLAPEGMIVIAHAVLAIPFVLRVLRPAFEQIDRRYVEAARSLGATRLKAFGHIEIPMAKSALLAGAAFGFALSLAEMGATIMLARPGLLTLPVSVYQLLAARRFEAAAAMATVLAALTGLAFVVIERLAGWVQAAGRKAPPLPRPSPVPAAGAAEAVAIGGRMPPKGR